MLLKFALLKKLAGIGRCRLNDSTKGTAAGWKKNRRIFLKTFMPLKTHETLSLCVGVAPRLHTAKRKIKSAQQHLLCCTSSGLELFANIRIYQLVTSWLNSQIR